MNSVDNDFLMKLLDEKENRARIQQKLIGEYKKTLISFGLNIPGMVKNSFLIRKFFKKSLYEIKKQITERGITILYEAQQNVAEGNIAFLVLDTEDSYTVKRFLIEMEEKIYYGRVLDIDVFNQQGELISRKNFNISARKCLLCDNEVNFCIKNRSHTFEELNEKAMSYIKKEVKMHLKNVGVAGTLESSDIMVTVEPSSQGGISIDLTSSVKRQFGKQIEETIRKTAMELGIENATFKVVDKGALEYAIIARTKAAIYRAAESKEYEF